MKLQSRLMLAVAGTTLAVAALFALFALAFAYTVEDGFIERGLRQEALRLQQGLAPSSGMSLHRDASTLPPEVAAQLAQEPRRREFAGNEGRHYHLLALQHQGQAHWLLAEVSHQLIVRPMRTQLLQWLAGWGLAAVLLALGLGWGLARRLSRPIALLSAQAATARPEALPALPGRDRPDEIGELARSLDALLARTRDFIAREQAFSRDASHELRTPLAVLRLGLERLAGEGQEVASLLASVQLMEQTVATLLQLAREPAGGESAPTPLLPIVETWTLAHAELLDRRGLRLDCRLGRHDSLALSAPLLQLALGSLLGNALVHAEAGGSICIELADGGSLRIRNAGLGASPGEGLGLALVQRLLERQGARLRFRQDDGHSEAVIEAGHTGGHA